MGFLIFGHATHDFTFAHRWLTWCREHKFVQCMEYDVPKGILPSRYAGTLIDVKVHGGKKRRCPDDKIYGDHEDLRKNVRLISRRDSYMKT